MPLDPLIANPTLVKMADPSEAYKNALQNAYLFNQIDEARQKRQDADDSRDAFSKAVNPDGSFDTSKAVNALAPKRADLIPGVLKGASDRAKVDAETTGLKSKAAKDDADAGKAKTERVAKEMENVRGLMAGVSMDDPGQGQHQMFSVFKQMAENPAIKEWYESMGKNKDQYISDRVNDMMMHVGNPGDWGTYVNQEKAGPDNMLDALKRETIQRNLGDRNQLVSVDPHNPNAAPQVLSTEKIGVSPNRPTTSVTVNNEATKAVGELDKKVADVLGDRLKGAMTAADAAQQSIPRLQRIQQLVRDGNVFTGVTGDQKAHLRQLAEEFGLLKPDGSVGNTQELKMLVGKNLMGEIAALKSNGVVLTPMSDADARRLEQAALNGTMTPAEMDRASQIAIEAHHMEVQKYKGIVEEYKRNPATASAAKMLSVPDIPAPGPAPSGTMAGNGKVPSPANIQDLRSGKIPPTVFDKVYGTGAAAHYKGQQPGGGGAPAGGATFQSVSPMLATPMAPTTSQQYNPPVVATPKRLGGVGQWSGVIDAASASTGVPVGILEAVMHQESGGDHQALSPAGAIGLMQLMPGTAAGLHVNPHDPYQNVLGGAKYLRQMYDKFGNWESAIAAYNAGPGALAPSKQNANYQIWQAPYNHGYDETKNYVKRIKEYINAKGQR